MTTNLADFPLFSEQDLAREDQELADVLFELDPGELIPLGVDNVSSGAVYVPNVEPEIDLDLDLADFDMIELEIALDAISKSDAEIRKAAERPSLLARVSDLNPFRHKKPVEIESGYKPGLFSIM